MYYELTLKTSSPNKDKNSIILILERKRTKLKNLTVTSLGLVQFPMRKALGGFETIRFIIPRVNYQRKYLFPVSLYFETSHIISMVGRQGIKRHALSPDLKGHKFQTKIGRFRTFRI